MTMKCVVCDNLLSKEDKHVISQSNIHPWCYDCVQKENERMTKEEHIPGTVAQYRSLPKYFNIGEHNGS